MGSSLKSLHLNILYDTMLQSFCTAQCQNALNNIPLTLGNKTKNVNLKILLAFIVGDI